MVESELIQELDSRAEGVICGITETSGEYEWICINPPHDKIYYRVTSDRNHRRGDSIFSTSPKVDQHYMVNRWPNREKADIHA